MEDLILVGHLSVGERNAGGRDGDVEYPGEVDREIMHVK